MWKLATALVLLAVTAAYCAALHKRLHTAALSIAKLTCEREAAIKFETLRPEGHQCALVNDDIFIILHVVDTGAIMECKQSFGLLGPSPPMDCEFIPGMRAREE
jgi:hypothetical protein